MIVFTHPGQLDKMETAVFDSVFDSPIASFTSAEDKLTIVSFTECLCYPAAYLQDCIVIAYNENNTLQQFIQKEHLPSFLELELVKQNILQFGVHDTLNNFLEHSDPLFRLGLLVSPILKSQALSILEQRTILTQFPHGPNSNEIITEKISKNMALKSIYIAKLYILIRNDEKYPEVGHLQLTIYEFAYICINLEKLRKVYDNNWICSVL
ncbi:unnamed protein product [Didymodactylos carnosus]|uniref:Uncharacterized protein n=1 Tax=Didymodactylos carnosus TaxID=1234261 RepID=A0A815GAD0_9BILA|nr:unnamed protein product [Didymodactylos carnosus]CAF4194708.1 unnamed protein product [Didymodactylos carnosus]